MVQTGFTPAAAGALAHTNQLQVSSNAFARLSQTRIFDRQALRRMIALKTCTRCHVLFKHLPRDTVTRRRPSPCADAITW
jgi:hypothetical protein